MSKLIEFLKQNPEIRIQDIEESMKLPKCTLQHAVSDRRGYPNKFAVREKESLLVLAAISREYKRLAGNIDVFVHQEVERLNADM